MRRFAGRVAIVTGAASGIGRELAVQLADRGCRVAAADIDTEGLAATCERITSKGATATPHVVDVSDRQGIERFAADVVAEHGSAHILVNNAGVTVVERAEKLSRADFDWVMKTNFWGVVNGVEAFLPQLSRADEAHIVNVSSVFGIMAMPLQAAYNASKFAVRGYTEALKMELSATNIGVSCVHPGGIKTNITRNSRIGDGALYVSAEEFNAAFEKQALTTPAGAAATIIRGIERNRRRILIGRDAKLIDWIVRFLPGSYEKWLRLEDEDRQRARQRGESLF